MNKNPKDFFREWISSQEIKRERKKERQRNLFNFTNEMLHCIYAVRASAWIYLSCSMHTHILITVHHNVLQSTHCSPSSTPYSRAYASKYACGLAKTAPFAARRIHFSCRFSLLSFNLFGSMFFAVLLLACSILKTTFGVNYPNTQQKML